MRLRRNAPFGRATVVAPRLAVCALSCVAVLASQASEASASDLRLTPVVRAVRDARPAVVNIQGQKTVSTASAMVGVPDSPREVNGMGTGVVIDPRGYILTNHHVVDGVRRINVTLDGGQQLVAHLVAHDSATDLAIIKIRANETMSTIRIGTSSDLMTGEPVIALGNAYGYEHTVTRGVISALHRDVQVTDTQSYDDLIQTDASINPGNSGGPLLNIDGEMIGLNVAVRAGAQGIGFAIPVDMAMTVAANLLSVERLESRWHGLEMQAAGRSEPVRVRRVAAQSPAEQCGLQPGDAIESIGSVPVLRSLDVERALLGRRSGESVPVEVVRGQRRLTLDLVLAPRSAPAEAPRAAKPPKPITAVLDKRSWELFGIDLTEEPRRSFRGQTSRYRGGMRVTQVRDDGPAALQGIRPGDILVGMHEWETASKQDIDYIVRRADQGQLGSVKFYVVRDGETLYGHIEVARSAERRATSRR